MLITWNIIWANPTSLLGCNCGSACVQKSHDLCQGNQHLWHCCGRRCRNYHKSNFGNRWQPPRVWYCDKWCCSSRLLADNFRSCSFSHVKRIGNSISHFLARRQGFQTQIVHWTVKGRGSRFLRLNQCQTEVEPWLRHN